ncbi:hypothetical protein [Bradyrhizobium phage BDU-MI-1]|nr:hypothetical protein [Bradyrhizobium phage BDU-MI-1]
MFLPFRPFLVKGPVSIIPGSVSYTTPGSYTFQVPFYHSLTVDVRGGGGGGAGNRWTGYFIYESSPGNYSYFAASDATLIGYGGGQAYGSNWSPPVGGVNGSPGTAAGGDSNITGGGSAGGQGSVVGNDSIGHVYGGSGGYGGRAVRTWVQSQWYTKLAPRSLITVVVGAGGAQSPCEPVNVQQYPTDGQNGAVYISWS